MGPFNTTKFMVQNAHFEPQSPWFLYAHSLRFFLSLKPIHPSGYVHILGALECLTTTTYLGLLSFLC